MLSRLNACISEVHLMRAVLSRSVDCCVRLTFRQSGSHYQSQVKMFLPVSVVRSMVLINLLVSFVVISNSFRRDISEWAD